MKYALIFLGLLLFVSGCGERTSVSNTYSTPDWTKDGQVACLQGITNERADALGGTIAKSTTDWLTYMDASGANAFADTDITADLASNLSLSSVATLAAYAGGVGGGTFNKIVIRYLPSASGSHVSKIELNVPNAVSFDWDSTGGKIVYCNTNGEIRTINIDGTGDTLIIDVDAASVAWKNGDRIAFTYLDSGTSKVSLINSDGTNRLNTNVASVANLCVSRANTFEVFGVKSSTYVKINTQSLAETVVIASLSGSNPRLALTGDKIVFDSGNSLYTQDFSGAAAVKIK
ncbi:hypothetical protein HZC35_01725 [Candidatus Saganbacteria bacterium]|nr:hypothetical protein [Candidatus Saganbacteria bacterium]